MTDKIFTRSGHHLGGRVGWYWVPGQERTTGCSGDFRVIIAGLWIRLIWGITVNNHRPRFRRTYGYGHTLLAARLWPLDAFEYRLAGIQWQREKNRMRHAVTGKRIPA